MWKQYRIRVLLAFLIASAAVPLQAQRMAPPILNQVGIDQRLNDQLPLDVPFRDETGRTVMLSEYFGGKPVLLSFAYYTCPMLCPMTLEGIEKVLRVISLQLGKDFVAVNISINSKETPDMAAARKADLLKGFTRPSAAENWHFLTGDVDSIQKVAQAAGYRYAYDSNTGQYIHASGIMVVTPEGKMSRYFYGIEFAGRDVQLGLVDASSGKIGSVADQVLLYCFHYDPQTGKYGLVIMNVIRLFGTGTALVLVGAILIYLRRERRQRQPVP